MLCFPALTPVANDAHAVGDSGECVVCRAGRAALSMAAMCGSLPSASSCRTRSGSMPSNPRITSFCRSWLGGAARADRPEAPPRGQRTRGRRHRHARNFMRGAIIAWRLSRRAGCAVATVTLSRCASSARLRPAAHRPARCRYAHDAGARHRLRPAAHRARAVGPTGLLARPWKTIASPAPRGGRRLLRESRRSTEHDGLGGCDRLAAPARGEPNEQTARSRRSSTQLRR